MKMLRVRKPSDELELTSEELEELVLDIPISERRLVTTSADFSVATLVSMLREKNLEIPPYQRKYIWSEKKASRLIESLILQCPIPVLYLNRRPDEVLEVVDGNQRVNSLKRYLDGAFSLSGLTAYTELAGETFETLDQKFQRQIKNRTIRCVIIEPETHSQIKFDVFERLNSGSTPLSPQELRHGLYYGPFSKMLSEVSSDPAFVSLTSTKNDKRMRRDELALRFFAFTEDLDAYRKPLSAFLTEYLKKNRHAPAERLTKLADFFSSVFENLNVLLGSSAFRFKGGDTEARKFNTAYFDAVMVGYATSNLYVFGSDDLKRVAPDLRARMDLLMADPGFRLNTLRATSDKAAIEHRIHSAKSAFNEFA